MDWDQNEELVEQILRTGMYAKLYPLLRKGRGFQQIQSRLFRNLESLRSFAVEREIHAPTWEGGT